MYLNLLCHFYLHVSWFVQLHSWFDITNGFALKNYTNLTFHFLNSLVCISIYVNYTFISADLYSCTADLNSPLDWPWKTTQFDLSFVKFLVCISICVKFTFISADLYSCTADLNSPLDLPWKTSPIWPLICETPWCVSQFYLYVSWFVQLISWFDITTGFALKNYPNLTFNMLNSLVCISIYGNFTFMSADLYRWSADLSSLTAVFTPPSDLSWNIPLIDVLYVVV